MDTMILAFTGIIALLTGGGWALYAPEGKKGLTYDFVNLSMACLTASLVTSDYNLLVLFVVVLAYYFGKKIA